MCEETRLRYAAINRRALLGGAAVTALPALLGGCKAEPPRELEQLPDVTVMTGAIAQEETLIALYEAALAEHSVLAGRIEPILAHHREHLKVLRGHLRPGTDGRAATSSPTAQGAPASPDPSSGIPAVPDTPGRTLSALRLAERKAAAARIVDVGRVRPGVAQLLASIGTCEAAHAAVLTGVT